MRKEDWSVAAVIFEAVDILSGLAYCGMQIYYGVLYHIMVYKIIINILVAVLVYAGLTLLAAYPERLNNLPPEVCKGNVRKYSIRMLRVEKCLFLVSLLVPCICDIAAFHMPQVYSVIVILLMLVIAVYYEIRIIWILRDMGK